MHGRNVHQAVFNAQERQTGITIHYVSEEYDEGAVIAQFVTKFYWKTLLKQSKKSVI